MAANWTWRFIACCVCCVVLLGEARAQGTSKSVAALNAEVTTNLASGSNITAATLRQIIYDVIASYSNLNSAGVVSSTMLAAGAASNNVGSLSGALSGSLPTPSLGTINGFSVYANNSGVAAPPTSVAMAGQNISGKIAIAAGTLTSGHCVSIDSSGDFIDAGSACGSGGGGSGTVSAGTANQLAYYGSTGTTVSGNTNLTISTAAVTVGTTGGNTGTLGLASNGGGVTTLTPGNVTGSVTNTLQNVNDTFVYRASADTLTNKTFNTTLNTFQISGTTVGALSGTTGTLATVSGGFTTGHCISANAGNLVDAGVGCGGSGTPNQYQGVTVYWNGTAWVAQQNNGTVINTSSTTTCGVQEAITAAWNTSSGSSGGSVIVYGGGVACTMTTGVSVPAGLYNSFLCIACTWLINAGSANGISFDTQKNLSWKMPVAHINYNGSGVVINMSPVTSVNGNIWSLWSDYDFGFVQANTTACGALVFIQMTVNGASQPASSNFANNKLNFAGLFGGNVCQYNIRLPTPAGSNNAGGENWFFFTDNQDATVAPIYIGSTSGSSLDANWGTNHWQGGVGATGNSQYDIITDASLDQFDLTELNNYNGTCTANVFWGPNASSNKIYTQQIIACGSVEGGTSQTFALNNYVQGVFRAYSPTTGCSTGSGTLAASGSALRSATWNSKTVNFHANITVSAVGTCAGALQLGLPAASETVQSQTVTCMEQSTGTSWRGYINVGSNASIIALQRYDNTLPLTTSTSVICSGAYETQ